MKFKVFSIVVVLLLIQASCDKPADTSKPPESAQETEEVLSPKQKLLFYAASSLLQLVQQFGEKANELSLQLLKDEALLANDQDKVLEFKENLSKFVQDYEINKESELVFEIMEIYSNATDYYLKLKEENLPAESEAFILELLIKYNHKELQEEFIEEFDELVENFKEMFEDLKTNLDDSLLEWYEKFITLTDFEERMEEFVGFMVLASL